jgi:meso-butanediol dehydrogenase/(S,S)-butanediol dehydrogenase/diacetyl reductase
MTPRLAGRTAIITGGGGGIGAATGELFCAHGAKVLLVDRDERALKNVKSAIRQRTTAAELDVMACDVTNIGDVTDAVSHVIRVFGELNVLVNNAAIRDLAPVEAADSKRWAEVMSVNFIGALNFCKASVAELRKGGRSSVVNVSSCYTAKGRKDFGAYDATKAALLSLTRTLAYEEAKQGIRVNAVCPGGTLTPFTVGRHKARGISEDAMRKGTKADALLGRWAEASEIAHPILWLASEEASFVTGATLMVDGGCSIM